MVNNNTSQFKISIVSLTTTCLYPLIHNREAFLGDEFGLFLTYELKFRLHIRSTTKQRLLCYGKNMRWYLKKAMLMTMMTTLTHRGVVKCLCEQSYQYVDHHNGG